MVADTTASLPAERALPVHPKGPSGCFVYWEGARRWFPGVAGSLTARVPLVAMLGSGAQHSYLRGATRPCEWPAVPGCALS